MKIGKYEFNTEEQAVSKIKALGTATDEDGKEYPNHKHAVHKIGNIKISEKVLDEDGELLEDAVYSLLYAVDVQWYELEDHPYGWKSYAVDLNSEGVHHFAGESYLDNKII